MQAIASERGESCLIKLPRGYVGNEDGRKEGKGAVKNRKGRHPLVAHSDAEDRVAARSCADREAAARSLHLQERVEGEKAPKVAPPATKSATMPSLASSSLSSSSISAAGERTRTSTTRSVGALTTSSITARATMRGEACAM